MQPLEDILTRFHYSDVSKENKEKKMMIQS
uniref:Uncharacterized protein n=1 Tax=Rhizophora mucronata TaxID=61149 RepID=A0A2P2R2F5_RHIMU